VPHFFYGPLTKHVEHVLLIPNYLHIFHCCFCYWVLVLLHCDQIVCRGLFKFSYICWDLLCALRYGLFWRKFHGLLKRMYIVLLQDGILCRHLSVSSDLWYHLVLEFLCWFLSGWPIYFWYRSIKVSHCHCVVVYLHKSITVCLMELGALTLGTYKLTIVISSWCIVPFISMKRPSLSLLTILSFKCTLSDVSIATPACFLQPLAQCIFFQPFILSQCWFLSIRWVSCKQQIVGSSFLIQFASHCILKGELSPLTFNVNIERYVVITAI
jgi:hypothetical protein